MQCIWGNHGFFYGHYASLCYGSLSGHYPCCVPVPHSHTFEYIPKHTMMQVLTCALTCCHSIPLSSPHVSHLIRSHEENYTEKPWQEMTSLLHSGVRKCCEVQLSWSPHTIARILHGKNVNLKDCFTKSLNSFTKTVALTGHCSIFRLKSDLYDLWTV